MHLCLLWYTQKYNHEVISISIENALAQLSSILNPSSNFIQPT